MTASQIIALVRDALIVSALGFLVYRIYLDGENRVRLADLQAVQKQLQAQAQTVAKWHEEAANAQSQHDREMDTITAAIGAHSAPVFLCDAPRAEHVSAAASAPASSPAAGRGPNEGSRIDSITDIRPQIEAFELKYEQKLADCRQLQRSWPH